MDPAGPAAGEARCVSLALTDVSHVFQPGHRIRLQVPGGAFPRFARNPGTTGDAVTSTQTAPVSYRVFHSARWFSMALPIRDLFFEPAGRAGRVRG